MKKRILITGATGHMGMATLKEIYSRADRFEMSVLARKSKKNIKALEPFKDIKIIWGDLTIYNDVLKAVEGCDYVLHIGGMVSPAADYYPNKTRKVNITAAQNVANAVLAQENRDNIKVCYVGSVAETSDRNEPIHWGRTGDPICISVYDHYAISKTIAERIIVESGIKNWVVLRQSGILYPELLKNMDPIMFHVPLRGVLEWATLEDSARAMANLCEEWVDDNFWCHFYNIGSGDEYRLSNYKFEKLLLKTIHCPAPEKIFNPEWFVLRNFHGQWYLDSDKLESFLHFRENLPVENYFERMGKQVPWYFNLAVLAPACLIKPFMRHIANTPKWGTQWWIKNEDKNRISAYYGSIDRYKAIKPWSEQDLSEPTKEAIVLDHGYDEKKPRSEWDLQDMQKAAEFRGGKCLSQSMIKGDWGTPLEWECQFGHRFVASPVIVLEGGHWCPDCLPTPWNYDEIAKGNPFFAQVWTPLHSSDEHNFYGEEIFEGWE